MNVACCLGERKPEQHQLLMESLTCLLSLWLWLMKSVLCQFRKTHPLEESVMARSDRRVSHADYQSVPKFQKVYYVNVGTMPIETMQLTYRG